MISRVTSYRPDHRLLRGCVAQPQDPAEWPLPPRPPDPGGAERGTGPHGSGAGSILILWSSVLSESALDLAQAGYKVQILPVLIWVAVHKKLQILVYFLSFNPPWRLTGPQTGERCAILENKLMKRTVHLTAWLAPYPILRGAKHPAQIWSKDSTWEICEYLPISVPPYLLEFVNWPM